MLPRNQRHRSNVPRPMNGDYSSEDEMDDTVFTSSEAITVTPKFSRLPSKIPSPKDSISIKLMNTDPDNQNKNTELVPHAQTKNDPSHVLLRRSDCISPILIQRPTKRSLDGSDSDVGNESDGSSSLEELDNDVSRSTSWSINDQGSQELKPLSPLACNRSCRSDFEQPAAKKEPSKLSEPSGNSVHSNHGSDIDDDSSVKERFIEKHIPVPNSGKLNGLPSLDASSSFVSGLIFRDSFHPPLSNELLTQGEMSTASRKVSETQLAEPNHPVTPAMDNTATVDSSTVIGQLKANISNSVTGPTSEAEKTHVTVAAPGNTIETRASTLLLQPGSITTPLASTTETAVVGCAMLGSSVTFYERPEYLDAQKRRTSHNTSDRFRQYNTTDRPENHLENSTEPYQFLSTEHKERDALPLAAVLASAEAIAARPSLYAASRDKEVQNRLGAPDSSDLYLNINDPAVGNDLRHGWQMNTSISSAANSTQPVMNSSNETNGFAPPTIIRIDNIINHEQKVFQQPPSERVQRSSPRECFYDRSKDQLEWSHRSQQTSDVGQPRDRDRFNPNPDRVVLVTSAYPQNDMHPMEDIQLASQRKSRILHGDAGYFDTSVKLISSPQTPLPQNAEVSYVRDNYDGESPLLPSFRKTSEIGSVPESQHQKFFGDVNYVDHTHYDKSEKGGGLSFGSSNAPSSVPVKKSHIRLMNAPQTTTPIQTEINEQISSSTPRIPSKQYGSRFSPPMIRPKWQLKPIPSDAEIRERLRSRSRQRAEERQSRVVQTEATSATRQRDSRSDSRYRFTDLDSAIAESRGETTVPKRWPQSGVELDSQVKKLAPSLQLENRITTTSCSTQRPPPSYSGIHAIASLNTSTRRFFGDAKSYSSLLETDIDTGENYERPILLETDVDNMVTGFKNPSLHSPLIGEFADQKTRSLFNLTLAHTPGSTYRGVYPNDRRPDLASTEPEQNWQRTKSLQGLPHREQESSKSYYRTFSQQSKLTGVGAKGLLERLRDRAKSDHELRIAQSLTKLHVPEWLDKAECLTRSSVQSGDGIVDSVVVQKCISSDLNRRVPAKGPLMEHSRPLLSSIRSSPSTRHPEKAVSTGDATNEASRSKLIGGYQPKFIRPSQELRERGSSISRLRPITSKLHNSMQTLLRNLPNDEIRPQAAPRATRQTGQSTEMKLSPQDFVPKREQIWGHEIPTLNLRQARDRQFPVNERIQNPSKLGDRCQMISEAYENVRGEGRKSYLAAGAPNTAYSGQVTQVMQPISRRQQANVRTMYEDIKPADYDSGTEHSGEHSDERPHCSSVIITQNGTSSNATQNPITQAEFTSATQSNYQKTEHQLAQNSDTQRSEWNSIDADGETESEVTDGLDQISDLTCLTSLVDTFASRHRALLANRPTALDHLLTGLGWWPSTPQPHHHHSPPTAAEAISIAAHEFDVDEDSHRSEFIDLLAGPESRRPINLGEFALNQLTDSVKRKKEDGLLYISCGRSECTKPSVKVANAANWCACANCYTLYCSTACRSIDRQSAHDHPTVCSFARARRVCTRILRSFAPGQLNGLTALAKTGMARLGRGGILLPFALVRHAELFLERSKAICSANEGSIDNSLEYAYSCWENHHLPSPGGLMSPPIYLTISELEELDSTVANPCRRYAPSSSMVLLVVVCAYELIARSDGRPVHLFKQSLVVPFPAHQTSGRSGQKQAATETQPVTPTRVTSKPSLPQTNGMVNKPDRQAIAAREAYMIRLQRMLRERGVSLRHHYPEIYTHIANFVENGVTFTPIRILFHDFVLREEVICTIKPMSDPHIQPTRELQSQRSKHDVDVYEDVVQDGKGTEPVDNKKRHRTNHPESISRQGVRHSQPETDF
ncbi:unnamed protein product [Dicrocoelium dendriticum]|nr:unnamed protein product [Dicrocoelium dendriticum]